MSRFGLDTAVCGLAKNGQLPVPKKNGSLASGHYGDDAGFLTVSKGSVILGIADGVGGGKHFGFQPGMFSANLMQKCAALIQKGYYRARDLQLLLQHAYDHVTKSEVYGSSTACLLSLDRAKGELFSSNLGDSGFKVIRRGKVVAQSRKMFNGEAPRQLVYWPWRDQMQNQGIVAATNLPCDAECSRFQAEPGDIITLGTDGVLDNLTNETIIRIIGNTANRTLSPVAEQLVTHAANAGIKSDDMLVIVARVRQELISEFQPTRFAYM